MTTKTKSPVLRKPCKDVGHGEGETFEIAQLQAAINALKERS